MREMKDSGVEWIGEIPKDWEAGRINALYEERNVTVSDVDYPPLSVTKLGIVPQLDTAAKTDNGENRKLIKKNDFVINSRSDRRGSCGISEYDGSCSLINTILKPRRNMVNSYYNFVFRSERFADEFYKWGNGIVDDLWSTKWSSMKKIYVPVPSVETQHRIADYLDTKCAQIDRAIARQQEVIEKLKEYKLSVITEAVTKGLNHDVTMKDSGASNENKIPVHWQLIPFRHCIQQIEQGWSPPKADNIDLNTGWSVISLSAIRDGNFISTATKEVDIDANIPKLLQLQIGDFLMTRSNTRELVGDVCIVDKYCNNTIFPDLIYRITLMDNCNTVYIKYFLRSHFARAQIQSAARGTSGTMPKISHKIINNLQVILPPMPEQILISRYLDSFSERIEKLMEQRMHLIDKLTEYKKSLIYEVVTGKREV